MNWRQADDTVLKGFLENSSRIGLVTDMDGTISPIVERPEDAKVTECSRVLLGRLADRPKLVAVLSGRQVNDLQSRIGLSDLVYVGSHGYERWVNGSTSVISDARKYELDLMRLRKELEAEPVILRTRGVALESKTISLAVHYRLTHDPDETGLELEPVMRRLASDHHLTLMVGRRVFEFRLPVEMDKGVALEQLVSEYDLDGVIYLGDDTSDMDAMKRTRAMREDGRCRAINIAVASAEMPPDMLEWADLLANGVPDVEEFLAWLGQHVPNKGQT